MAVISESASPFGLLSAGERVSDFRLGRKEDLDALVK
jgi:hypothetical protein